MIHIVYVIMSELSVGNDVVGSDGEPVDPVSQRVLRGTEKNYENLQASW
jgi:hypothetical protein